MQIYCDMDGVIANFNAEENCLERFSVEKGFFKSLQPIEKNVRAVKQLIKKGYNVNILSASPNEQADKDKIAWLSKHLPEIKAKQIILCRLGEDKSKYVKNIKESVLIDDYTNNLIKWIKSGGQGVKFLNEQYDNVIGKHNEYNIPFIKSIEELA